MGPLVEKGFADGSLKIYLGPKFLFHSVPSLQ